MNTPAEYTDYNGTMLQMSQVTTGTPLGTTEPPILPDLVGHPQQPGNRIIPTENRFMRVDTQNCSIANISVNGLLNATVCTTSYIYNWREYITYLPLLLQVGQIRIMINVMVMIMMAKVRNGDNNDGKGDDGSDDDNDVGEDGGDDEVEGDDGAGYVDAVGDSGGASQVVQMTLHV